MSHQTEYDRIDALQITDQDIIAFLARKGYIGGRELQKLAILSGRAEAARLKAETVRLTAEAARLKAEAARDAFNLAQTEKALKRFNELVQLEEVATFIGVGYGTARAYGENKRLALRYGVTELKRLGLC